MTCDACTLAATDPNCGYQRADCNGCAIRALATSPRHIREKAYASALFETKDMAAVRELQRKVQAEHDRIKALKTRA